MWRYSVCRVIPSSWHNVLTFVSGRPIDAIASRNFIGVIFVRPSVVPPVRQGLPLFFAALYAAETDGRARLARHPLSPALWSNAG